MMHGRFGLAIAAACAVGLAACAPRTPAPPPPTVATGSTSTDTGGARAQEVTVTATVEKVDLKERLVTLRGPDGNSSTIRVGEDVRNLPQVKRGDQVVVTYYESIAFEVLKPGEKKPGIASADEIARAQPGEKPGGVAARATTLVAKIVKLDRKNQQAVLRGPEGKSVTVNVQNPENFDKVKVGDTVEITYTEALAIDVQPAAR